MEPNFTTPPSHSRNVWRRLRRLGAGCVRSRWSWPGVIPRFSPRIRGQCGTTRTGRWPRGERRTQRATPHQPSSQRNGGQHRRRSNRPIGATRNKRHRDILERAVPQNLWGTTAPGYCAVVGRSDSTHTVRASAAPAPSRSQAMPHIAATATRSIGIALLRRGCCPSAGSISEKWQWRASSPTRVRPRHPAASGAARDRRHPSC